MVCINKAAHTRTQRNKIDHKHFALYLQTFAQVMASRIHTVRTVTAIHSSVLVVPL